MRIDIVTIFPEACHGYLDASIIGRARRRGLIEINLVDPRAWAGGRHRKVDDRPYGGGPGMVMMAPPLAGCLDYLMTLSHAPKLLITSPQGSRLDQAQLGVLNEQEHLVVLCGHYEGIDERIIALYDPQPFSIGDLVISGGELASLVLADALTRLRPGALGNMQSAGADSFANGSELDHPCYTRPREFRELEVPNELITGDHAQIAQWRSAQRRIRTDGKRASGG
jgi:tRNA (guanine37-N1)-methyltransferase